ncbi:shikimate kinase [Candidatus Vidania fulgoroideorum]
MINIIGLPSNGKTTFFNFLKKKFFYNLYDIDFLLEKTFYIKIKRFLIKKNIFFFRNLEKNLYFLKKNIFISTGGGFFVNINNFYFLNKYYCICIYNNKFFNERNIINYFSYYKLYNERKYYTNFISIIYFKNESKIK